MNEVIVVDNTSNLFFDNLSTAIDHGVAQTINELIAVVHEDVKLIDGWQVRFEQSLDQLERQDASWGLLGSVGWAKNNAMIGHWSDPFQYTNTFGESGTPFGEVHRLDEQILIFNRERFPQLDKQLPGIHHIGRDLSIGLRKKGLKTYAIDAPTIHKFRDKHGRPVPSHDASEKIQDRKTLTYLADKACCDNYIARKWPQLATIYSADGEFDVPFNSEDRLSQLDRPVILLSRGGSGSRLLSQMAADLGIFLGNELNRSGDSMEMAIPIYRAIIEKYLCKARWQKAQPVKRLRAAAAQMIKNLPAEAQWGFKLPESILLLPEFQAAFPKARYVHLVRDPLTTCLRRTHMTARLDNHIGRITLPLAYDFLGLPRQKILDDDPVMHMACTTRHQLALVGKLANDMKHDRLITIRFEDVIANPRNVLRKLSIRLDLEPETQEVLAQVSADRARTSSKDFPSESIHEIEKDLAETRAYWGYDTMDAAVEHSGNVNSSGTSAEQPENRHGQFHEDECDFDRQAPPSKRLALEVFDLKKQLRKVNEKEASIRQQLSNRDDRLDRLNDRVETQSQELKRLQAELASRTKNIEAMGNSLSWRLTAPLRFIFDWLILYPKKVLARMVTAGKD